MNTVMGYLEPIYSLSRKIKILLLFSYYNFIADIERIKINNYLILSQII